MLKRCIGVLICIHIFAYTLTAQDAPNARPTDDLVFKIAIFGPSDKIFIWWGHAALIVENTRWNFSRVFDWGIFSYPSDDFLWDFLHDRVRYKCTSGPLDLDKYIEEDRDIVIYTLDLEASKKEAILNYAENKVLPENCYYDYHEFRNNCSTGIRDVIDIGTGGQLKAWAEDAPGRFSLRQHIRRFTGLRPGPDWLLDFLMGQDLDEPVSVWREMFLPAEIARHITGFQYTGDSGAQRKLVSHAEFYNASKSRLPVLPAPLTLWPYHLALGVLVAAFLMFADSLRGKWPGAGILWNLSQSVIGLFLGAAGCILVFGLFFLNNDYVQQNINILFVNPLLLAAVPLGVLAANRCQHIMIEKYIRTLWTYVFIAGLVTILIKALPMFGQQNQPVQALVLPIAFALSYVPQGCRRLLDLTAPKSP
jgi:hypothetical protein